MKESNPFLEAALFYAQRKQWRVFPIAPKKKAPPLTKHGFQDASTSEKQIRLWWEMWPEANVAVPTGVWFWALDIDPRNGGEDSRALLVHQHGALRDTLRQTTGGGGAQYLYEMPDQARILNATEVCGWKGIDVRGLGGYIIVPPSIHPSGNLYVWDTAKRSMLEEPINPADAWLIEAILGRTADGANGRAAGPVELPERLEKGKRDDTIYRMACAFRRARAEYADVVERLVEYDRKHCVPPLGAKLVEAKVKSAWKHPAGDSQQEQEEQAVPTALVREHSLMSYNADCPDPKPIIEPIFYSGLTILGGRPKAGKSWLALQLGIAVVNQLKLGGYLQVQKKSKCLYVSLEDRRPQLKKRLHHLVPEPGYLDGLDLIYDLRPLLAGGAAQLDETLTADPVDVLIVDSLLAAVQAAGRKNVDIMQADYNIIRTLRELATKHAIALLLIAHTRKMGGDFVDLIQGTSGTTAAADAVWVLQRTAEGNATLSVIGREVPMNVFALERAQDSPAWMITGEGDAVTQSDARQDIIQLLHDKGVRRDKKGKIVRRGLSPSDIARNLHKNISGVNRLLAALCELGLVVRTGYGLYNLPGEDEPLEACE